MINVRDGTQLDVDRIGGALTTHYWLRLAVEHAVQGEHVKCSRFAQHDAIQGVRMATTRCCCSFQTKPSVNLSEWTRLFRDWVYRVSCMITALWPQAIRTTSLVFDWCTHDGFHWFHISRTAASFYLINSIILSNFRIGFSKKSFARVSFSHDWVIIGELDRFEVLLIGFRSFQRAFRFTLFLKSVTIRVCN